jgi:hypothetical protein
MLSADMDCGCGHVDGLGGADSVPQAIGAEDDEVVAGNEELAL